MWHVTLTGLLQAAAVVTVVFSLLTLLPFDHHAFQLFTHFRLQYLVVSLLLLVAFAALRSPWYAAVLLVTVIVNGAVVAPWYRATELRTDGRELKILHANVLSTNSDHDRLLSLIRGEQPDLVFLQEISPAWERALSALHTDYPHHYVEAREGNFGIAVFSKTPVQNVGHIDSAPLGHPTLSATLPLEDRSVRLVSTHPMIPLGERLYVARNEQLDEIGHALAKSAGPTILIGDLNATMWDVHYRKLEKSSGLRSVRRGYGILPTWPTFLPFAMIPIDHVLVSKEIGVKSVTTGPRIGSDHLPLVVTLTL